MNPKCANCGHRLSRHDYYGGCMALDLIGPCKCPSFVEPNTEDDAR